MVFFFPPRRSAWRFCRAQFHTEEFPSGQRGQTVNLLSSTSVVRIHPPPPKMSCQEAGHFLYPGIERLFYMYHSMFFHSPSMQQSHVPEASCSPIVQETGPQSGVPFGKDRPGGGSDVTSAPGPVFPERDPALRSRFLYYGGARSLWNMGLLH